MQNTEIETNTTAANNAANARRISGGHGDTVYEAARRYGLTGNEMIDFSSNVNPLGPPPASVRAAKKSLDRINRYPETEAKHVRLAIARYFGIKPEHVICGSGATGLIHLIPRVFQPKKVLIPMPTFPEYSAAVISSGGKVVPLLLQERTGFRIDPIDMALSLKGVDMAYLCNPNNPTGLLVPKAEMLEIVKFGLDQGVRLVIDEAFMDFINSDSIVKEAALASNVICIRSFSNFFGMPGLRIGYAVSDEATVAALREGQEPWTLNIPAEDAATAALDDWRYAKRTLRLVQKERERLLADVRLLPGVEAFPCSANFIFIKVPESKGPLLAEKLALRGILVRDCASFPGLDSRFLRIAVRTGRENKRLLQALRELLTP